MNRNSKSHFSATDNRINTGRSRFDRNSWWKGTFNTGDLVPFYLDEVLPGDTFDMKTSVLARMSTPIFPVMDNSYLDTYYFFVPSRLVWDHWKQFMGENDINAWVSTIDYEVPQLRLQSARLIAPDHRFDLCDYFGLPVYRTTESYVSALPFRAYQLIWNEWFRDQNLQDPVLINKADSGENSNDELYNDVIKVRRVNKFHDYFTSCLPEPQKGSAVLIPGFDGTTPVVTSSSSVLFGVQNPLRLRKASTGTVPDTSSLLAIGTGAGNVATSSSASGTLVDGLYPSNLVVGSSSGVTIDALRYAFQLQKFLWRDGNGGSRYTEMIRSHFGVVSPDARLQRPEYLGGKRIPITVNQVVQQSATDEVSPQGNVAAISKTVDSFNGFQKSFTEHGYIIGVCCIRTDHTYQDGINKLWLRKDRFDFYWPEFAHIGEQPVLNKEIFASIPFEDGVNDSWTEDGVFGYQEAWASYRYRPSFVTGAFRSDYPGGSLDAWHYADDYNAPVYLSSEWIEETPDNVERSLAVTDSASSHSQWLVDFYFDLKTTRPMPVYSVPGLVDHF